MLNEEEAIKVLERLKNHPQILEGVKNLLDVAEGVKGIKTADEAEFALIDDVRGLGKKTLEEWAKHRAAEEKGKAKEQKLYHHSKKN